MSDSDIKTIQVVQELQRVLCKYDALVDYSCNEEGDAIITVHVDKIHTEIHKHSHILDGDSLLDWLIIQPERMDIEDTE